MNKTELQIYNEIQNRIDELEEEIYALTGSRTIKFNPFKRIIRIKDAITKKHNYQDKSLLKFIGDHLNSKDISNNTVEEYINNLINCDEYRYINDNDNERIVDESSTNRERIVKVEIDYQEVINYYHHFCPSLPKVTKITEARKKLINARLKDYSVDEVKTAFKLAEESDFLTGRSGKWGGANFDWIMNTNNIVKILEGNYKNKTETKSGYDLYRTTKQSNYDFEALERETKQK